MDNLNNNIIWHYTNYNVLEKIFFENKNGPQMRATHFKYFEDHEEIIRAAKIALKHFKNQNLPQTHNSIKLLKQLTSLEYYLNGYYVLSFAIPRDSLYHWKTYANKDQNGGCAIGFNQNQLSKLFSHVLINEKSGGMSTQGPMFRHPLVCIYENREEKIKLLLDSIVNKHNFSSDDEIAKFENAYCSAEIISSLLKIKTEKYKEDAEIRLVFYYKPDIKENYNVVDNCTFYHCKIEDKPFLYCPFNMKVLQDCACPEIMLAGNSNIGRGMELVTRIKQKYNLNIRVSISRYSME